MTYEDFIRDARVAELTPSTRLMAASHAIYWCCACTHDATLCLADTRDERVEDVMERALARLALLSAEDVSLVRSLFEWELHTAPLWPLPMLPGDAIALAERVRKVIEVK
ncbi:hypothetical protein ACFPTO_20070 [Paraburkholderia denitrificans]|uniref:Uncharacterized protein n=1 Tax=Paraburkholderia denitrificans TaxID=694025 RepID=A0ABW0JDF0_9BURK